jgi:hypothetical protein
MPSPAPPSSSGNAIPIHPSLARAACNSCGYSPDSSCCAQYSYEIFNETFTWFVNSTHIWKAGTNLPNRFSHLQLSIRKATSLHQRICSPWYRNRKLPRLSSCDTSRLTIFGCTKPPRNRPQSHHFGG